VSCCDQIDFDASNLEEDANQTVQEQFEVIKKRITELVEHRRSSIIFEIMERGLLSLLILIPLVNELKVLKYDSRPKVWSTITGI